MKTQKLTFKLPHTSRSSLQMPKHKSKNRAQQNIQSLEKGYKSMSMHLPPIKLRKVLNKIGALNKSENQIYIPPQEDQKSFRASKINELKQQFPFHRKKRSINEPFRYQLDQIVLDCYEYGQKHGKKSVWRKYRQNIDSLTFDTLKILSKRGKY